MVEEPWNASYVLHDAPMARRLKRAVHPQVVSHPVHFNHWLGNVWAELVSPGLPWCRGPSGWLPLLPRCCSWCQRILHQSSKGGRSIGSIVGAKGPPQLLSPERSCDIEWRVYLRQVSLQDHCGFCILFEGQTVLLNMTLFANNHGVGLITCSSRM